MREADVAAVCFVDPINIRYATDASNMQVWSLHNPVRYAFVATDGPARPSRNCGRCCINRISPRAANGSKLGC